MLLGQHEFGLTGYYPRPRRPRVSRSIHPSTINDTLTLSTDTRPQPPNSVCRFGALVNLRTHVMKQLNCKQINGVCGFVLHDLQSIAEPCVNWAQHIGCLGVLGSAHNMEDRIGNDNSTIVAVGNYIVTICLTTLGITTTGALYVQIHKNWILRNCKTNASAVLQNWGLYKLAQCQRKL